MQVKIADLIKLIVATVMTVGILILLFYGKIASDAAYGLLGALLGYVLGNGHAVLEQRQKGGDSNA